MISSRKTVAAVLSLVGAVSLIAGCAADGDEVGSGGAAATVGRPSDPVFGEYTYGAGGYDLKFKNPGGTPFVRKSTGNDPMSIEGDSYGPALSKQPNQNAGWFTNSAWKCVDAEKFALDRSVTADASQDCYMEINTTGGSGFSVSIIGLDAKGKGLTSWTGTPGARPAPVNAGAEQLLAAGPPRKVNITIDHDAVLDAMVAAHDHFRAPVGERNDCLKNARAGGWLDVQSHYYCELPYSDVRTCYSTKLIEVASNADPKVAATAPGVAYETCFAKATSGNFKWVHDNQEAVFKYVMFTKQGKFDFELNSENKVVNDFYAHIKEERPRRVVDTYPKWLPDQPRYEAIRKAQSATQATEH